MLFYHFYSLLQHNDIGHSLALHNLSQFLRHKPNTLMLGPPILLIQKLIKSYDIRPTSTIILLYYPQETLSQPSIQLPDLHIEVEVDQTDIFYAFEGEGWVLVIEEEFCIGFNYVDGDVLPDLHVYFLYVDVLKGVIDEVEVVLYLSLVL